MNSIKLNVNNLATVKLNDSAKRLLSRYFLKQINILPANSYFDFLRNYMQKQLDEALENETYKDSLWVIMNIFGEGMYNGAELFKNCEIEIEFNC